MASHLAFVFLCLFLVLYLAGSLVSAEIGCPPPETITPCICDDRATPRLVCSSIYQTSVFEEVFRNAARYTFQEVHIQTSVVQYFPRMMFEEVRINELYIENCTVVSLFEDPPVTNTLEKLQIVNTRMQRGHASINLKNVTNLKTLIFDGTHVLQLRPSFTKNLPSSLKEITLRGSLTRSIKPGAFDDFPLLDKLEVSSNRLKNLTRDMFPRPFNARFVYFDNNNISYIPSDLFNDMPELQFLSMKNNNITEVPEAAFGYRKNSIPYLRLDGNPLQCNCLLVWLVKNKPEIIRGTCHSPRSLAGKKLQDLSPGDFNCF